MLGGFVGLRYFVVKNAMNIWRCAGNNARMAGVGQAGINGCNLGKVGAIFNKILKNRLMLKNSVILGV